MDKDYLLEHLETKLQDLEKDYETESANLRNELDGSTQNKLKRKVAAILQSIDECRQNIADHQQKKQLQAVELSINVITVVLKR